MIDLQKPAVLKGTLASIKSLHKHNVEKLGSLQEAQNSLREKYRIAKDATVLYRAYISSINRLGEKYVEDYVNKCLKEVFYDKPYKVTISATKDKKKKENGIDSFVTDKKGEITILDCSGETPLAVSAKHGVGMGIRMVISFAIHSQYILATGAYPCMFLDEVYQNLSDDYIARFMTLMKRTCDETGLRVVLISHDSRLFPYVDNMYIVSNGKIQKQINN